MYQFPKLQFYRYHSCKLWINILMLCLHAHILLESQQLNWETEMLRTLQTLQVESNSTNTQCSTLTKPMLPSRKCTLFVTKFGMPVGYYQVWNACCMLPSMKFMMLITKNGMPAVSNQVWNACCMLPSMECLLYITKYGMPVVHYQVWNACC